MKALVLVFAIFGGAQVFAATNCNPYIVANGEAAGEYVYPCGKNYDVTYRSCNEGEVAYTSIFNGESYSDVAIVCRNGSFVRPANKARAKHRSCNEGEYAYSNEFNGEFYQQVTLICKNGRFVHANP